MCYAVRCGVCGKTTWEGCGLHVEDVRSTVPPDQWCDGHRQAESSKLGLGLFGK